MLMLPKNILYCCRIVYLFLNCKSFPKYYFEYISFVPFFGSKILNNLVSLLYYWFSLFFSFCKLTDFSLSVSSFSFCLFLSFLAPSPFSLFPLVPWFPLKLPISSFTPYSFCLLTLLLYFYIALSDFFACMSPYMYL